ncbi:MAG: hypothetical protein ACR2NU_09505, partial [Aeoliella sp.]
LRNGKDTGRLPYVASISIQKSAYDWAQGLEEDMDPRYGHPVLTFPQPPLVGRNWDELARHSEVPLASEMEVEELIEDEDEIIEDVEENPDAFLGGGNEESGGRFGGRGGERMGRGGGEFGRGGGEFGRGGGEFGRGGGEFGRGGGEFGGRGGGERGGRGGRGGGFSSMGGAVSFDENGELEVKVPFLMLRFFDLSVQPGKRYKYRIKLIMKDPNYQQRKSDLDAKVLARERKEYIRGEWSEPSPTISIPQAGIIRVAESKSTGSGFNSEPTAQMLVESFGLDEKGYARQAYKTIESRRGAVMNFHGEVEVLVDGGRFIEKIEDFSIDTGVTVLDLDGGEKFTREMIAPTQALFMDSSGRLYLRDELYDEQEVALHKAMFDDSDTARGGGRDFSGEMEFGREGGGGRGGR